MRLVWQLAWRYLKGKRSANAVPILSRISMFAIAVGAAAMIILFSIFNGFEGIVKDLYKAFYPEIKITAAKGKFFALSEEQYKNVQSVEGVSVVSRVMEDNVLLKSYTGERQVATIKGVDENYFKVNDVASYMSDGICNVATDPVKTAVVGSQLATQLGLDVTNVFSSMEAYYPNPKAKGITLSPQDAFRKLRLRPEGAFSVQDEFDSKYIIADLGLVQELIQAKDMYSSLELKLLTDDAASVQEVLQELLGSAYLVQTRYEQNQTIYMVMRAEKWAVYGILLLVLVIAAFNMVGALSMLVLEKQKDIAILKAMGATSGQASSIFVTEGVLWSLVGGGSGLLIGALLCIGQKQFGWIKLGGTFIIDAYPVQLLLTDFLVILATIITIGVLAAWFPAIRAARVQAISLRTE